MKWSGWWVGLVVAALALLAAPASAADTGIRLTVDRHVLYSGQQLSATASGRTDCTWILTWAGQRQVGHGTSASARFTAPTVTKATRLPVRARCFPVVAVSRTPQTGSRAAAAGHHAAQRLTVTVPSSRTVSVVVTVLPAGGAAAPPGGGTLPPSSGLPPTGGPPGWLVLAGFGSLLAGAVCVSRSARPARR